MIEVQNTIALRKTSAHDTVRFAPEGKKQAQVSKGRDAIGILWA